MLTNGGSRAEHTQMASPDQVPRKYLRKAYMGLKIFSLLLSISFSSFAQEICHDNTSAPIDLTDFQLVTERIETESYKLPNLSCDLSKFKSYPEVLVIGELHWGSDSSAKVKKFIMNEAKVGKIHLLIEVIPDTGTPNGIFATFPWTAKNSEYLSPEYSSPYIGGIESLIPKSIMEVNAIDENLEEEIKAGRSLSLNSSIIAMNTSGNPMFKAALNRMDRRTPTSCKQCISLFKKISEAKKFNNKVRYTNDWLLEITQEVKKIPTQEYFSFVRELNQEVIKLATPEIERRLPQFKGSNQRLSESELEDIVIKWRDEDFALSAANWLCANSDSDKKLSVLVGDAHAPGVISNLKKLTKDTAKITYKKSHNIQEANSILYGN